MESKLGIRILLTVGFAVALLAYHATNAFLPSTARDDLFLLLKITQILALTLVTFLFVTNEFLGRLMFRILGAHYIGGTYEGHSSKGSANYPLYLQIKQSAFGAHVEAQSKNAKGDHVSNWTGALFKIEGNKFYFGISLDAKGIAENGVLDVAFNNGELSGYYRPAHHKSEEAYPVTAKRRSK